MTDGTKKLTNYIVKALSKTVATVTKVESASPEAAAELAIDEISVKLGLENKGYETMEFYVEVYSTSEEENTLLFSGIDYAG